eukprot:scaffold46456_cov57-Phaeocystis_antarctica.AAC.2
MGRQQRTLPGSPSAWGLRKWRMPRTSRPAWVVSRTTSELALAGVEEVEDGWQHRLARDLLVEAGDGEAGVRLAVGRHGARRRRAEVKAEAGRGDALVNEEGGGVALDELWRQPGRRALQRNLQRGGGGGGGGVGGQDHEALTAAGRLGSCGPLTTLVRRHADHDSHAHLLGECTHGSCEAAAALAKQSELRKRNKDCRNAHLEASATRRLIGTHIEARLEQPIPQGSDALRAAHRRRSRQRRGARRRRRAVHRRRVTLEEHIEHSIARGGGGSGGGGGGVGVGGVVRRLLQKLLHLLLLELLQKPVGGGDVGPVEATLLGIEAPAVGGDRGQQQRAQSNVLLTGSDRRRLVRHKRARRAGGCVDTPRIAIAGVEGKLRRRTRYLPAIRVYLLSERLLGYSSKCGESTCWPSAAPTAGVSALWSVSTRPRPASRHAPASSALTSSQKSSSLGAPWLGLGVELGLGPQCAKSSDASCRRRKSARAKGSTGTCSAASGAPGAPAAPEAADAAPSSPAGSCSRTKAAVSDETIVSRSPAALPMYTSARGSPAPAAAGPARKVRFARPRKSSSGVVADCMTCGIACGGRECAGRRRGACGSEGRKTRTTPLKGPASAPWPRRLETAAAPARNEFVCGGGWHPRWLAG